MHSRTYRRPATGVPRVTRLLACASVAVACVALAAGAAGATTNRHAATRRGVAANSIGVQLLDVPTAARADPRALLYIIDHLRPGRVIHRRIEISNTTPSTLRIAAYPAGATIAHGLFLGAGGHTRNELSTWTSVTPRVSDVRSGGHLTATVTIAVPRKASRGERYEIVWAETRTRPLAGRGITEVSRVGIRVYLSVGPGGAPPSRFKINSLVAKRSPTGQPMVVASVQNTGGRSLDVHGTLQLSGGPGGLNAGPFPARLGITLGVGDTEPVTITLNEQLPRGPWHAQVILISGLNQGDAHATLTFPASAKSSPPYLGIIGLAALLLGVGVLLAVVAPKTAKPVRPTATDHHDPAPFSS